MNLLHTIGLMTRAEHEAVKLQAEADKRLLAKLVKQRDDEITLWCALEDKFKRAATDLAAQAELVSDYEAALGFSFDGECPICGGIEGCSHSRAERIGAAISRAASHEYDVLEAEIAALRPDAEAMRKKRAADRKPMAGKRGKDV